MSASWQTMIDRLDATRAQWWLYSLLCGLAAAAGLGLAILMFFVFVDLVVGLSASVRLAMFWLWCAAAIVSLTYAIYRSFRHQRTRQAVARCVEAAYPEVGNDLINLVQLAESNGGGSEGFRQAALAESSFRTTFVPIERVAGRYSRRTRWRWALHAPRDLAESGAVLAIVIGLLVTLNAASPRWKASQDRVLKPWDEHPQTTLLDRKETDHERRI